MRSTVAEEIRKFILEEVLEDGEDDVALPDDLPLLSGMLDSFGLMSLLSFLEDRYDLVIKNDQVVAKNFETISALSAFIEEKIKERDAAIA